MNELPKATGRFPKSHQPLLIDLMRVLQALRENTRDPSAFPTTKDPLAFYNRYIEFAIALYLSKFRQLYEALAASVEAEQYLLYAATGRAIIENAATLRYYSFHPDLLALQAAWGTPQMSDQVLRCATNTLDTLVRGNRFTWEAFVAHRFDELASSPDGDTPNQIKVGTCLDKWYKVHPPMRALYALFCDLVHPNLGSNFLTLRVGGGELLAGGEQGQYACDFIILPTLAGILGIYSEVEAAGLRLEGLGLTP